MFGGVTRLFRPQAKAIAPTEVGWTDYGAQLGLPGLGATLGLTDVLRLGAVVACLDVLAQDIGKTPVHLYRRTGGGRERVAPGAHPIARLLNLRVNPFQHRAQFFAQLIYNLKLWGNAYVFTREEPRTGRPLALYVAPTAQTIIGRTKDGGLAYRLSLSSEIDRAVFGEDVFDLPERLVIHLRQRSFCGVMGVGALQTGAPYFSLAKKLAAYRADLYASYGLVNGVFEQREGAATLSEEAFTRLDRHLRERYQRFRSGDEALLLEGGLTYKAQQLSADSAQVKDALQRELTDACRLFRVPPHKIAALESVKYDNIEPMERAYASEALDPAMVDIELAFAAHLLSEAEQDAYFFEFDRDRLQVVDMQTRVEKACQLFESGLADDNEARERLGMNPRPAALRVIRGNQAVVDDDNRVAYPGQGQKPE